MSRRPRDEHGQTTLLVIGFATVVAMAIAVVVDASAAYLQRSGLNTLADGAALQGADLGVAGEELYSGDGLGDGLGGGDLAVTRAQADAAVRDYLRSVGAYDEFPGLSAQVSVRGGDEVVVRLSAPLDLPLTFPGSPDAGRVSATGSAVTRLD